MFQACNAVGVLVFELYILRFRFGLQSRARTRAAIPLPAQLRRRPIWPPTCWHQPSGSASGQVDNRRQPTPVVGPRTWNDLPDEVTSAESLLSGFRQRLKT